MEFDPVAFADATMDAVEAFLRKHNEAGGEPPGHRRVVFGLLVLAATISVDHKDAQEEFANAATKVFKDVTERIKSRRQDSHLRLVRDD